MDMDYNNFLKNITEIEKRIIKICKECKRNPEDITLLPVTKNHGPFAVEFVSQYGLKAIGENRIQETESKKPLVKSSVKWELIGHLQSNKTKRAVELFDRIQTVDRIKLVKSLSKQLEQINKSMPILIQINSGEDPSKYGATVNNAPYLLEAALKSRYLKVEGLMTVAPIECDNFCAIDSFKKLKVLRDQLEEKFQVALPVLSMGMTSDMDEAIKAGSTMIRIGTALFGDRVYA